jgi:hypothetical protein
MNQDPDMSLSMNKKLDKTINGNSSVYIPKNKITKFNNDINNIKNKNDYSNNNIIKNYSNINQNLKRSSPIKEMSINLKKINVCRLNDLNQLYLSQNLMKNNSNNNISFSEINNMFNINNSNNNNNIGHTKFYSNIIKINNNNNSNNNHHSNNISIDKNKLKKISSAKNGVYVKPKEKIIKEIKIQNNQNNKMSPYENETHNSKTKNAQCENIFTISNHFFKNKNFNHLSKLKHIDSYSINTSINNSSNDNSAIKKIYIRRNSKKICNNSPNDNKIEINKNSYLSTLLSFKNIKEKNNKQNEILIKHITTKDKRIFINISYVLLKNHIKTTNKYNLLSLQESPQNSISIINNKFIFSEYESKSSEKINISDIFRFDNDKKKNNKNNESKKKIVSKDEKKKFIKLKKIIKEFIKKKYIKFIFNIYKRDKCLRKIILNKKNKILYYYFSKLNKKSKYNNSKADKNNGVYHKINYNDNFNLSKRMKTPNNDKQKNKIQCKTKAINLTNQNSINKNKIKSKINSNKKKGKVSSAIDFNSTQKYKNKEINIFVHK